MIHEAYEDDGAMSRTRVFEWHKKCEDGRVDVEDEQRAGRPTSTRTDENVAHARELFNQVKCSSGSTGIKFYAEVLERLKLKAQRVRKEIADIRMLHHDNAPSYTSLIVRKVPAKTQRGNAAPTILQFRRGLL